MEASQRPEFSIRTITAGVNLESPDDPSPIEQAARFLVKARAAFEQDGFTVQSTRTATQPLASLYSERGPAATLQACQRLDQLVIDLGSAPLSVGPLIQEDLNDAVFPSWAAELVEATRETYFSIAVSDSDSQVFHRSIHTAAATIQAISHVADNGEANFRFAAAARLPAATPFFPVAYHEGAPAFSIGLESAGLVGRAFTEADGLDSAATALRSIVEDRLLPIQTRAATLSKESGRRYAGIDLSPAPSLDASIAAPIEQLTGQPFGATTTLTACATLTRALQSVRVTSCGYSGLMLPLLEDRVLAKRAEENRFGVQDLLFYSSVCGTGLDVIPLPGGCDAADLAGLILDVATLATRLRKPLAARLLPIPGKQAGDRVDFANPHLTGSIVLPLR